MAGKHTPIGERLHDLFNQPPTTNEQRKNREDHFTAAQLRDKGIELAEESAEQREPSWNDKCYALLIEWLKGQGKPFLVEDFRAWSLLNGLSDPPSRRAFGGVILRAAKAKLVRSVGFGRTSNPKAHKTPATLWLNSLYDL